MSLEITGKLVKLLPEQSGQGRNGRWVKQEFVVETQEQYPKKVCFSAWNDKIDALKSLTPGELLTVSFNAESREYNERWYTDLRAWKITAGNSTSGSQTNQTPPPPTEIPPELENDDTGLPF